jgi:hypothetical protein
MTKGIEKEYTRERQRAYRERQKELGNIKKALYCKPDDVVVAVPKSVVESAVGGAGGTCGFIPVRRSVADYFVTLSDAERDVFYVGVDESLRVAMGLDDLPILIQADREHVRLVGTKAELASLEKAKTLYRERAKN